MGTNVSCASGHQDVLAHSGLGVCVWRSIGDLGASFFVSQIRVVRLRGEEMKAALMSHTSASNVRDECEWNVCCRILGHVDQKFGPDHRGILTSIQLLCNFTKCVLRDYSATQWPIRDILRTSLCSLFDESSRSECSRPS